MNGSKEQAEALVKELIEGFSSGSCSLGKQADVAICPPAVYLDRVSGLVAGSDIKLGAQNCSEYCSGAYTGELSAEMLVDLACQYVILGHSERRALFSETDQQVAKKFETAKASGLVPVLCVGETLDERESGKTLDVVSAQINAVIDHLGQSAFDRAVIAYEPVWAIGTGKTASPEQAQEVHKEIRSQVAASNQVVAEKLQILYGGSMNAKNAQSLMAMADIDGGLVGGASLKAEDFLTICQAASR
ncbi:triose-phosphate isomerase [Motiliproteus sp. MSK22-1]|nr:triose-phosphate isomerase [Motiliproteus sp. MSK22-1]